MIICRIYIIIKSLRSHLKQNCAVRTVLSGCHFFLMQVIKYTAALKEMKSGLIKSSSLSVHHSSSPSILHPTLTPCPHSDIYWITSVTRIPKTNSHAVFKLGIWDNPDCGTTDGVEQGGIWESGTMFPFVRASAATSSDSVYKTNRHVWHGSIWMIRQWVSGIRAPTSTSFSDSEETITAFSFRPQNCCGIFAGQINPRNKKSTQVSMVVHHKSRNYHQRGGYSLKCLQRN